MSTLLRFLESRLEKQDRDSAEDACLRLLHTADAFNFVRSGCRGIPTNERMKEYSCILDEMLRQPVLMSSLPEELRKSLMRCGLVQEQNDKIGFSSPIHQRAYLLATAAAPLTSAQLDRLVDAPDCKGFVVAAVSRMQPTVLKNSQSISSDGEHLLEAQYQVSTLLRISILPDFMHVWLVS